MRGGGVCVIVEERAGAGRVGTAEPHQRLDGERLALFRE
ncbi:MAG: hypothetical protein RL385_1675 [Pseudomonadota bacterium]